MVSSYFRNQIYKVSDMLSKPQTKMESEKIPQPFLKRSPEFIKFLQSIK
jgi:hypothetical protein